MQDIFNELNIFERAVPKKLKQTYLDYMNICFFY